MKRLSRTDHALLPLRILQFGEGNFLRGSVDWMVQQLNDQGLFDGSIQIVQPISEGSGDVLNEQGGLYTVLLGGGHPNDQSLLISCVRGSLNAYRDWQSVLDLAAEKTLRFVLSNTTESGIEYVPEPWQHEQTPTTFPGKLTAFLFKRFQKFSAEKSDNEPGRGLIVIPCESVERNGSKLKSCVLRYADEWKLGDDFIQWIETENRFLNTLLDRIVPGYPKSGIYEIYKKDYSIKDADDICKELGYEDRLLVAAEPYCFFAIEGPESLDEELPLRKAGLNVVWADDITPYQTRYNRIFDGARIAMAPAAFLWGAEFVHHPAISHLFNSFLHKFLEEEVLPAFDLSESDILECADATIKRLLNYYMNQKLLSLTHHSVSKWKTCVLPTLLDYWTRTGQLPELSVFSLAALIVFNRVMYYHNGIGSGHRGLHDHYEILDDKKVLEFFQMVWRDFEEDGNFRTLSKRVLSRDDFWGRDLNEVGPLTEQIAVELRRILHIGISRTAMSAVFPAE